MTKSLMRDCTAPPAHPVADDRSRRSLIGIPVPVEDASWRVWAGRAHLLGTSYADRVRQAGAVPVLLPVGGSDDEAHRLAASLDGLMIAGGSDVDPGLYGQLPHEAAGPFDPERDGWEIALLRAALEAGLPVFGICRGMQLLNVVLGGTLTQHLPDQVGSDVHNPTKGEFALHRITTAPDSPLRRIVGAVADVPTYHHQAVEVLAPDLTAAAWAEDGTVEAVEDSAGRILGVQWHPEVGDSDEIFRYFVGCCATQDVERSHAGAVPHQANLERM
ncbi:gamma-glutamyl-gamma-aminobutyrate hydrolase family protein [Streptomyces sp. NPDC047042]|uniref:gamma-glutamyl-gamma-aminobutyrate hydrolase family protein n=1 Tax=Streptomyces sp. NPDC047042 TaxID=3154807 RepID=UPI0033D21F16